MSNYDDHEMRITDDQARLEWGTLIGFELNLPTVKITHQFYCENIHQIHAIQMNSHIRLKQKEAL